MSKAPISVMIPTLDEELNLPEALKSTAFAEQVVVLDSHSHDKTASIALDSGAELVLHAFENYSAQKNWGLENIRWRHRWIFILDADERITPELARELSEVSVGATSTAGFYVNRRFYFQGKWLRHAGWYPNWNLRFFRHGLARYDGRLVHEHMVVDGSVGYMKGKLLHQDRRDFSAFLERHNRYSTLEAWSRLHPLDEKFSLSSLRHPTIAKRLLRQWVWPLVPVKPLSLFAYLYLARLGILDGREGLVWSLLQATQELDVNIKLREAKRWGQCDPALKIDFGQ